ncbi:unnamed protein product [Brassica oleracea var. botrytis]
MNGRELEGMISSDLLLLDTKILHALVGLRDQQLGPRREQIARQQKEEQDMGGVHWTLSRTRAIVVTLPRGKDQNRRLLPFPGSSEDSKTVTGGPCHEFKPVEPDAM